MKTAKIGAIFLVSVMALAGASAGYAWWTDHLYIKGEITTDTFGAEWGLESYPDTYFSHFIKWADGTNPAPDNPDYYDQTTGKPIGTENVDYWVIATGEIKLEDFAGPEYGQTDTEKAKTLRITVNDVFPSTDVVIWGKIKWYGSVPGHLASITDVADITYHVGTPGQYQSLDADWDELLWLYLRVEIDELSTDTLTQRLGLIEGNVYNWLELEDKLVSSQWHEGEELVFVWYIHFIQYDMIFEDYWGNEVICEDLYPAGTGDFDVPENAMVDFTYDFYFEQWNRNI